MASNVLIDKDEIGVDFDITKYICIFKSLLYLTVSRLDIMFSVYMYARYQESPKESHVKFINCISEYLNRTSHHGLWYLKGSACSVVGFSNSYFVRCKSERKITSGTCHLFSSCLVSWHSKKHHGVALSTDEAEYVAIGSCCAMFQGEHKVFFILA